MIQPNDVSTYFINNYVNTNDAVIDATLGNGYDTLKLCKKVGIGGKVYAFDIQKTAIENAKERLENNGYENVVYIQDSHENMKNYVSESVKAVIFNLGYLPGGDKSIHTNPQSTIKAINEALSLISDDGFISVMVYHGKDTGTIERDEVLKYLKTLDHKKYTVLITDFFNRPNNPPINVVIMKNKGE